MDIPARYRIRLQSQLDTDRSMWFEGMHLSQAGDHTVLEGVVSDQAALHGLLARVRDMGLILVSIQRDESRE